MIICLAHSVAEWASPAALCFATLKTFVVGTKDRDAGLAEYGEAKLDRYRATRSGKGHIEVERKKRKKKRWSAERKKKKRRRDENQKENPSSKRSVHCKITVRIRL